MNAGLKKWLAVSFSVGLLAEGGGKACAQSSTTIASIDSIAVFQAIPNDVAFQLLDLPGNGVEQPGTVSEFLASIQPVLDSRGMITPGIAVSLTPYQLLRGDELQLADYARDPIVRILSNLQFSLGSAASQNADSSQDWGIGMRITLLNTGDGRLDTNHIKRLVASALEIFAATSLPETGETVSPQFLKLVRRADELMVALRNSLTPGPAEPADREAAELIADSLDTIANELDTLKIGSGTGSLQSNGIREFVGRYREINSYLNTRNALKEANATTSWNTTTLDIEGGAVYRSTKSKLSQSAIGKYRFWVNGGIGLGASQLLAQVGLFHQLPNGPSIDSTSLFLALMYRIGNEKFRFGIGGNGYGLERGALNIVAELRISRGAWIVVSLNREFSKGFSPTWNPAFALKTTGGAFGI
jgi:hypothetical protein